MESNTQQVMLLDEMLACLGSVAVETKVINEQAIVAQLEQWYEEGSYEKE